MPAKRMTPCAVGARHWRSSRGSSAALIAVGELLFAKGDLAGGTTQLELAIAVALEGTARIEVERKLFHALLDRSPPEDASPAAPVSRRGGILTIRPGSPVIVIPPSSPAIPHDGRPIGKGF